MDLLDRYLQDVKKHLPWERQDDIVAELKANLEAQLEDKEAARGRPLTTGEVEAWLKQIGPPRQVAARYRPQRYLIGPALFPTYWVVLQAASSWVLVIFLITSVVQAFAAGTPGGTAVILAVLRVPGVLITTAAWVTAIFAAIEFAAARNPAKFPALASALGDWSPRALPPVEKQAARGRKPRSYAQAVIELVLGFLCLGWWLLVPKYPYLLMGPGAVYLRVSPFQLAPAWVPFYWCVAALTLFQLGWRSVYLWRGSWREPQTAQKIAMSALGLIPVILLLTVRDHALIFLQHPALDQARYGEALRAINKSIYLIALLLCAIAVLQLLWVLVRTRIDAYRKRAAAMR